MFKKILVGIDTSVETQHAFDDALTIAKATGATLSLMHVFSWDDAYEKCLARLYSELEEMEKSEKLVEQAPLVECIVSRYKGHEQTETLLKYLTTAQKEGIQVEIETPRLGRPGLNLCNAAKINKVDLIAVGHRDKNWGQMVRLGEFRLGSVSHDVIHRAPCSVLIAQRRDLGVGALKDMGRILTAWDGSAMSQVVFQESLDLAKATGASLTLLHILSSSKSDRLLEKLQILKERANAVGVSVSVEQLICENYSIGKVICEFADEQKIDLIFVGRRRLLEVQEQVLGSVSHFIAYHAPCAVIIVNPS